MAAYLFVLAVGLVAGVVSGVIGTGSSMMLLPLLVWNFGAKQAVPIMAVASVVGNISRVLAWWKLVDWKACLVYAATGVPAVALGTRTMLALPEAWVSTGLGIFFLLLIPFRRWLRAKNSAIGLWQLCLSGLFIGYISGVVSGSGPLSVAAFSAYGLVKGAFIATEAAASLVIFSAKTATFGSLGALPLALVMHGLLVGGSIMAGTFLGKTLLLRMSIATHQLLLDGLLFLSGVILLWTAFP